MRDTIPNVKSVRLDARQEERLREAARSRGVSQSEFIRQAVEKACDEALAALTAGEALAEWIDGLPDGFESDDAAHSEEAYVEMLRAQHDAETRDAARSGQRTRRTA